MRNDEGSLPAIMAAEIFLQTYGIKPHRPEGWTNYINDHGDSRCRLLRALGLPEAATKDLSDQLDEELLLAKSVDPFSPLGHQLMWQRHGH